MALVRRDDLLSPIMRSWFDDLSFFNDDDFTMSRNLQVEETDDEVVVKAPVYGVDSKDVLVNVQGNVLRIRGESKVESKKGKRTSSYSMQTNFDYYYTLPARVDSDSAEAVVKNGVVTVTMPKKEADKGKNIVVKSE